MTSAPLKHKFPKAKPRKMKGLEYLYKWTKTGNKRNEKVI